MPLNATDGIHTHYSSEGSTVHVGDAAGKARQGGQSSAETPAADAPKPKAAAKAKAADAK